MATQTKSTDTKKKTAVAPKAKKASGAKRTITIKLAKGTISCNPNQRACVNGLGLKRREQTVTLENTSAVRGMIKKVLHLVEIVGETR